MTARKWRHPGLLPLRKKPPDKKLRTGRCQDSEEKSGRTRKGNWGEEVPKMGKTPQGMTETWVQAKGGKGGSEPAQEIAADAGTRRGAQVQAAEDGKWQVQETSR